MTNRYSPYAYLYHNIILIVNFIHQDENISLPLRTLITIN